MKIAFLIMFILSNSLCHGQLQKQKTIPILRLSNDENVYKIKLTNVMVAEVENGKRYMNFKKDSIYYCELTFGMKKFEYELFNRNSSEMITGYYPTGNIQFIRYQNALPGDCTYRYLKGSDLYEFTIYPISKFSDDWVELKIYFSKMDIKKSAVDISCSVP